jgi:hypothetical protein
MMRVLLDTNLLLLLVVGRTDERCLARHRRLRATYLVADFRLLETELSRARAIVTTPNILTETWDLLTQGIQEPDRSRIALMFREMTIQMPETYIPSRDAVQHEYFLRLGLADIVSLLHMEPDIVLLSVDAELCVGAMLAGHQAVNFNHLRDTYTLN